MAKARHSKAWTAADALAEIAAADPCSFVLETSPPDYVEKISRFLESSDVGVGAQHGAAEADSDSADSLFITQKPVPEAVRSGRRRHTSFRSDPTSPRFLEESEDDASPSTPHRESRSNKEKKKVKFKPPKYSFPFLKGSKQNPTSTSLPALQNIRLHYSAMGGFFKCVRQLWQSHERGENVESDLPAVDMNGECISPISEEDEEQLEDVDIKVVAKKQFVVQSKVKHSQPWYTEKKRDGEVKQQERTPSNARDDASQGEPRKILHQTPTKTPSLRTALCSDLESSDYRILGERDMADKQQTGDRRAQIETPKTKRHLNRKKKEITEQKENEDELCGDSSPNKYIQKGREALITEPQADVFHKEELSQAGQGDQNFFQSDANNDAACNETRVKKKEDNGDNESAEEEKSQNREEPEVRHAAASVSVEITEVEETPCLSQTINAPEPNEINGMEESDIRVSKQKKKKKQKSPAEEVDALFESDVRVEENSVHLECCNGEDRRRGKKKKKKRESNDDEEDAEQLKSNTEAKSLHNEAVIQKKKKKRKGQEKDCFENAEFSYQTSEPSYAKQNTHKDSSHKDISDTPEGEENTEKTSESLKDHEVQLVTENKKMREMSCMKSSDTVPQSGDLVFLGEKEKKGTSSFPIADVEGEADPVDKEKCSPSQSVAAEKSGVSTGDSGESAEFAGSLEEFDDRVRKKKKKKKKKRKVSAEQESVEKDQELDFEEPSRTCEEALSETGLKKKKKRKRDESKSLTSVQGLEPTADEGCSDEAVVLKKKKKKKVTQELPAAAAEDTELESLFEHSLPDLDTSGNNVGDKKKWKSTDHVLLESKSRNQTVEKEGNKTEKKQQKKVSADSSVSSVLSETSLSHFETSPSHSNMKTKHKKVKRNLYNPSEDFFMDG